MRILLTNDDGIRAPGLLALYRAIKPLASDILIVAPLTVQSATSHGVTFHQPLMTEPVDVDGTIGIAVDGRPADCVKLALANLWPQRMGGQPDLVVSGMNAGANVGINVIYSGTVAAAIEAAFLGVPSIAVSLHLGRGRPLYDIAATHAATAITRLIANGLPSPHACLSINIPRCETSPAEAQLPATSSPLISPPASTRPLRPLPNLPPIDNPAAALPIVVCPMNVHGLADRFEERAAPSGQTYYWSAASGFDFHNTDPGSDVDLLMKRCITVTPLHYDLTDRSQLDHWATRLTPET